MADTCRFLLKRDHHVVEFDIGLLEGQQRVPILFTALIKGPPPPFTL